MGGSAREKGGGKDKASGGALDKASGGALAAGCSLRNGAKREGGDGRKVPQEEMGKDGGREGEEVRAFLVVRLKINGMGSDDKEDIMIRKKCNYFDSALVPLLTFPSSHLFPPSPRSLHDIRLPSIFPHPSVCSYFCLVGRTISCPGGELRDRAVRGERSGRSHGARIFVCKYHGRRDIGRPLNKKCTFLLRKCISRSRSFLVS